MGRLFDAVINDSMDLWLEARKVPFVTKLGEDRLSEDEFRSYIIQDSLYLNDYTKCFGMAVYKSKSVREMKVFGTLLSFVDYQENATRIKYLSSWGLDDDVVEKMEKNKACREYTSFLLRVAENDDNDGILMSVLPCMLGYKDVFVYLKDTYPGVMDGKYKPLVDDYTNKRYETICRNWSSYAEERLQSVSGKRRKELSGIFREGSREEIEFWKMAGEMNE